MNVELVLAWCLYSAAVHYAARHRVDLRVRRMRADLGIWLAQRGM